ncbi:hypothetical protein [Spongiactinospora sp. TRM90649]|uniref:hypothetical protein n=1 Tax=Spongiactinospora sp. TRM90649 TaxID=3031114 RepID=UPI0023F664F9|nr:hypothetical protein [Spongiactinospora sp. TRM90649]MDF5756592.1 hypothetical protein [Spongiactinospora sp. TRM90649]
MTAPRYAVDTPNGRYYRDPKDGLDGPPRYVSVTNVINQWDKDALAPGAAKATVAHMMEHLPAAVRASRHPETREAFAKEARGAFRKIWDKAADFGTLVHKLADAHLTGRHLTWFSPEEQEELAEAREFLDTYLEWMGDFGVDAEGDVHSSEITVYNRTYGYAGTADLWVDLTFPQPQSPQHPRYRSRTYPQMTITTPSGLWLVDGKTSRNPNKQPSEVYRDHLAQLAALRFAETALLPDGTEIPVPQFVGTAILNLRPDGKYAFVPMHAGPQEFEVFLHLKEIAGYVHDQLDMRRYRPIVPPARTTTRKGAA